MYNKKKMKKDEQGGPTVEEPEMDIRKIRKDIEFLTSAHMTWKEKKETENRKVVSLGGKAQKKQRQPLSVARPIMKKQKEREQKRLEEQVMLGEFGVKYGGSSRRSMKKRMPEEKFLKSTVGNFSNGVLDVKHLLRPTPARESDSGNNFVRKGKAKGGKKNNKGKKKGGNKKRH